MLVVGKTVTAATATAGEDDRDRRRGARKEGGSAGKRGARSTATPNGKESGIASQSPRREGTRQQNSPRSTAVATTSGVTGGQPQRKKSKGKTRTSPSSPMQAQQGQRKTPGLSGEELPLKPSPRKIDLSAKPRKGILSPLPGSPLGSPQRQQRRSSLMNNVLSGKMAPTELSSPRSAKSSPLKPTTSRTNSGSNTPTRRRLVRFAAMNSVQFHKRTINMQVVPSNPANIPLGLSVPICGSRCRGCKTCKVTVAATPPKPSVDTESGPDFLSPFKAKQIARTHGFLGEFSPALKSENRSYRKTRQTSVACTCKTKCDSGCACAEGGVGCIEACACEAENCRNPQGVMYVFDDDEVQRHYENKRELIESGEPGFSMRTFDDGSNGEAMNEESEDDDSDMMIADDDDDDEDDEDDEDDDDDDDDDEDEDEGEDEDDDNGRLASIALQTAFGEDESSSGESSDEDDSSDEEEDVDSLSKETLLDRLKEAISRCPDNEEESFDEESDDNDSDSDDERATLQAKLKNKKVSVSSSKRSRGPGLRAETRGPRHDSTSGRAPHPKSRAAVSTTSFHVTSFSSSPPSIPTRTRSKGGRKQIKAQALS